MPGVCNTTQHPLAGDDRGYRRIVAFFSSLWLASVPRGPWPALLRMSCELPRILLQPEAAQRNRRAKLQARDSMDPLPEDHLHTSHCRHIGEHGRLVGSPGKKYPNIQPSTAPKALTRANRQCLARRGSPQDPPTLTVSVKCPVSRHWHKLSCQPL